MSSSSSTPVLQLGDPADFVKVKDFVRPSLVKLKADNKALKTLCNINLVRGESSVPFFFVTPPLDVKYVSKIMESTKGPGFFCSLSIFESYNPSDKPNTYAQNKVTSNSDFINFIRNDLNGVIQKYTPNEFFAAKKSISIDSGVREADGDNETAQKEGSFVTLRVPIQNTTSQLQIFCVKYEGIVLKNGKETKQYRRVEPLTFLPSGEYILAFGVHISRAMSIATVLTLKQAYIEKEESGTFLNKPICHSLGGFAIEVQEPDPNTCTNNQSESANSNEEEIESRERGRRDDEEPGEDEEEGKTTNRKKKLRTEQHTTTSEWPLVEMGSSID